MNKKAGGRLEILVNFFITSMLFFPNMTDLVMNAWRFF